MAAMQESGRRDLINVGYELMNPTTNGLPDGTLTLVISIQRLAAECLTAPRESAEDLGRRHSERLIPFDS